jgi:hypothetical protein
VPMCCGNVALSWTTHLRFWSLTSTSASACRCLATLSASATTVVPCKKRKHLCGVNHLHRRGKVKYTECRRPLHYNATSISILTTKTTNGDVRLNRTDVVDIKPPISRCHCVHPSINAVGLSKKTVRDNVRNCIVLWTPLMARKSADFRTRLIETWIGDRSVHVAVTPVARHFESISLRCTLYYQLKLTNKVCVAFNAVKR